MGSLKQKPPARPLRHSLSGLGRHPRPSRGLPGPHGLAASVPPSWSPVPEPPAAPKALSTRSTGPSPHASSSLGWGASPEWHPGQTRSRTQTQMTPPPGHAHTHTHTHGASVENEERPPLLKTRLLLYRLPPGEQGSRLIFRLLPPSLQPGARPIASAR